MVDISDKIWHVIVNRMMKGKLQQKVCIHFNIRASWYMLSKRDIGRLEQQITNLVVDDLKRRQKENEDKYVVYQ